MYDRVLCSRGTFGSIVRHAASTAGIAGMLAASLLVPNSERRGNLVHVAANVWGRCWVQPQIV